MLGLTLPARSGFRFTRKLKSERRPVVVARWFDARVAELADAPDLGSGGRKAMGVQIPPFAPQGYVFHKLLHEIASYCFPYSNLTINWLNVNLRPNR